MNLSVLWLASSKVSLPLQIRSKMLRKNETKKKIIEFFFLFLYRLPQKESRARDRVQ